MLAVVVRNISADNRHAINAIGPVGALRLSEPAILTRAHKSMSGIVTLCMGNHYVPNIARTPCTHPVCVRRAETSRARVRRAETSKQARAQTRSEGVCSVLQHNLSRLPRSHGKFELKPSAKRALKDAKYYLRAIPPPPDPFHMGFPLGRGEGSCRQYKKWRAQKRREKTFRRTRKQRR